MRLLMIAFTMSLLTRLKAAYEPNMLGKMALIA